MTSMFMPLIRRLNIFVYIITNKSISKTISLEQVQNLVLLIEVVNIKLRQDYHPNLPLHHSFGSFLTFSIRPNVTTDVMMTGSLLKKLD